jgi:GT2 family glycosyltransferase
MEKDLGSKPNDAEECENMTVVEPDAVETRLAQLERRLRTLERAQRTLDVHIATLESSIVFRLLRRIGRPFLDARAKLEDWPPAAGILRWIPGLGRTRTTPYSSWIEQEGSEELPPASSLRFSILMSLAKARRDRLEEAVASVLSQIHPHWELHLCHADTPVPWLAEFVDSIADPRIRISGCERNGTPVLVSHVLNEAANDATGDYLILLPPDGRMAPAALQCLAHAGPADLLYTDEDHLDREGRRIDPIFKPDWSPDLLLSSHYFGRLTAISRDAWMRAGGVRGEFEPLSDYDLALRLTDGPACVRHVPRVLYHGRRPASSSTNGFHETGSRALKDALRRRGAKAEVEDSPRPDVYQVRWKPRGTSLASLIICSRSPRLLEQCLKSVDVCTRYPHREVIVVQHLGGKDEALRRVIEKYKARRIPHAGPFHFSLLNNLGARAAKGEVLVFLNDDVGALEPSWLERMVAQLERPDVGVVGARLVYPSGTLQHAGVAVGVGDGCAHIGRGAPAFAHWPWVHQTRDVAAVTGACLAIRAGLFRELGGFDDAFPLNFNDTDLCLRVRGSGLRVIYDAGVLLRHSEGQTRPAGVTLKERVSWLDRWLEVIDAGDPFYSPHLTRDREDLSLRVRP